MDWGLSALMLARIQFAFTVSFHIIFPAITIGLASFLAIIEWRWLKTGQSVYRDLYQFWIKIFSVAFAMGVVSGVVMSYQFGTNWSEFSLFAGSVTGPLLAYEVLTAFFLEAGFLGIMLFGWGRVGPYAHFFATVMVALGTCISMFWILSSNSWMHTPAGFDIVDGRVVPVDWLAIVFNPSFPYRLAHMAIAAFLVSALLVCATGAWHLLKGRRDSRVKKSFSMSLWLILILAPLQAVVGDFHGLNTLKHQPAKIAAMEGHWHTNKDGGMPLLLFAIPDMQAEKNHFEIGIPNLGSLILTHSRDGQVQGLTDFAPEDRPNALIVFWTFRIMVGIGMLMVVLGLWGLVRRRKAALYESRHLQRFALIMGPSGFVALLAGWFTTEIGRQPWVIYGVMRTRDAVSPVSAEQVGLTLAIFVVVYFVVFGVGTYYMLRLLSKGPQTDDAPPANQIPDDQGPAGPGHYKSPMRPLSKTDEQLDAQGENPPREHLPSTSADAFTRVLAPAQEDPRRLHPNTGAQGGKHD